MPGYITYLRISTQKQEAGLSLDAQRQALTAFLRGQAPVAEFTETESGRNNDRPQLAKAIAACRRAKATLLIAKLDRLARSVAFISNLMESDVEFVVADFPQANRLTLHVLAAVAEHEARLISERTKSALSAAKARGTALGSNAHKDVQAHVEVLKKARQVRSAKSRDRATATMKAVADARTLGITTLRGIAHKLNEWGRPAPRGGRWRAAQVKSILDRTV
jgi:DNA invertase Pin-like site-specific DNA recombinase